MTKGRVWYTLLIIYSPSADAQAFLVQLVVTILEGYGTFGMWSTMRWSGSVGQALRYSYSAGPLLVNLTSCLQWQHGQPSHAPVTEPSLPWWTMSLHTVREMKPSSIRLPLVPNLVTRTRKQQMSVECPCMGRLNHVNP